ncbi:MAG: bifunctional adenosylcobinamide hydrolase/alpha-ribazole phosphatase CbiS [Methanomassiliicoccales archaeon]
MAVGDEKMSDLGVKVELRTLGKNHFAIIRLPGKMKVLASTMRNGGFAETDTILMMQVEEGYDHHDPEADMAEKLELLGLEEHTVGFMTAAWIHRALTKAEVEYHGVKAVAVVTAGVVNAVMAGELLPESIIRKLTKPGTINTVVVVDVPLEAAGFANAIITATEAKSAAMFDRGIRGTGTTSDAVAICAPHGKGTKYAGTATDVGIAIARAVRQATARSIGKWFEANPPFDLLSMLERKGVGMEELWSTAQELYCPNPEWDVGEIRRRFIEHIEMLRNDVNVNCMVQAAVLLEEEGNRDNIHGLMKGEFHKDPVHLVADEMLGIALSEYIAGTRALFEYTRYDKKKPGVLKKLGPFLDDIVAALIGGTMSKIYTDLLGAGR